MSGVRSFGAAVQLLTRLPLPRALRPEAADIGAGAVVLWFPAVGLLIGLLLWLAGALLGNAEPLLRAALLLTFWVLVTGALHLDGLADSADAWVGGHGDRARTLAIMKDPYSGPVGTSAVVLVLLVKFAALAAIPAGPALLLAPLLARTLALTLFSTTPYVREGGIGAAMHAALPRRPARLLSVGVALAVGLAFGIAGVAAVGLAIAWLWWLRARAVARLGGITGDLTGALVEVGEAVVLVALALLLA